jgi:hypothetical protein
MVPVCATITVIVLGAYVLAWKLTVQQREDERRLEEDDKVRCPSLTRERHSHGTMAVLRCELEEGHIGPHTAKADGYVRSHWK